MPISKCSWSTPCHPRPPQLFSMYVPFQCGYAWSKSLGRFAHFGWRASSHRRLVHVRRDILLHNMRQRLLHGQCTTVEPCMPTPKSRSTKVRPMPTLYACPHWGPELSMISGSRSSWIAIQMTKEWRKTCQVLQAKLSSISAQLSALTGPSWEAMGHEASRLSYCHPSFLFE